MKTILTSFLLLLTAIASAQTAAEINAVVGIPDSLEYSSEIRIYKSYGITDSTEILRVYDDGKEYKAELYHFHNDTKKFEKKQLKGKLGNEMAWMRIYISGIEHLPQWKTFQYKFDMPEIVFSEGSYVYQTTTMAVSDGVGYDVFYKSGKTRNHIEYGNPESYLRRFPGVDELEMFSQMLTTIREEFDIWKEGR